ncbi:MAG: glycosyltransferase [Burkholderiales bacterium]|jgi:glycosyltransferase involved in cell wall biosynthesis|nr:glycosyltransferase [Burkholderiales bacterium]
MARTITVACPILDVDQEPAGTVPVRDPVFSFVDLPTAKTTLGFFLRGLPIRLAAKAWSLMGKGDLVFGAVVEHPLPFGWIVLPLARARGCIPYTFLESAAWRPVPGLRHSLRYALRAAIVERMNRLVLRCVRFAFITQDAYRDLVPPSCPTLKSPASWFLPDERLGEAAVAEREASMPAGPLRLLFAARLAPAKGIDVLLDALAKLDEAGDPVQVTVLGSGEMLGDVRDAAGRFRQVTLEIGQPVPYGPAFHAFTRGFDALVVANLSDEQPRIIFDAYAQAVPVIVSDTTGNVSIVEHGVTGIVVRAGSSAELADAIRACMTADGRRRLQDMGIAGWKTASPYDHVEMHRQRYRFIADLIGKRQVIENSGADPAGAHRA